MKFEDLDVWKRSTRLSAEVKKYPANHKDSGLKDQITKLSLSFSSNIAEGFKRFSGK